MTSDSKDSEAEIKPEDIDPVQDESKDTGETNESEVADESVQPAKVEVNGIEEEIKEEAKDIVGETETEIPTAEVSDEKKREREEETGDKTDLPTAAPAKKPKPSSEEPMGELRPTDVLAGNYRKRPGNFLYKKLLRDFAPEVGKVEMRVIVAKVVDGISGQDPPGRFIREGGDALLSRAQTNQKVARALREVSERSQKAEGKGEDGEKSGEKAAKKQKPVENQEPLGEIRPTDVLTGNYRKRPGNFLYKKLLRENAPLVGKEEIRVVATRVIEGIYSQEPPGRFIREGGGGLLTRGQIHQKVARALREVVERSQKADGEKGEGDKPGEKGAKKQKANAGKEEDIGEIRPTDVLTGNYRKRPGNFLYKKLLREHAPAVGKEEMRVVVGRVIEGINQQDPPGRFIREGGGALLTRGQVHQKVARALREVVERTKDKEKKAEGEVEAEATVESAAESAVAAAMMEEALAQTEGKGDDEKQGEDETAQNMDEDKNDVAVPEVPKVETSLEDIEDTKETAV